ncbi:MAG: hypothetical protein NXI09_11015 [Bacteroidetes bacterium]|nr:hypothetical protein [Bacteroidota bacterium]
MFRAFSHIVIILTVLFSQLYNSAVSAVYSLNRDYYATELCEEKSNPNSLCEGSCFFSKQLNLKSKSAPKAASLHFVASPPLFFAPGYNLVLRPSLVFYKKGFPFTDAIKIQNPYRRDIEHPPEIGAPA